MAIYGTLEHKLVNGGIVVSLLSYIAFPREVEMSCLKSMIDRSKMVKIKDLKGTIWEKNYIGLPDDLVVYIGNSSDSDELQIYEKDPHISFKKVFENRFIYRINAKFSVYKPEVNMAEMDIEGILKSIQEYDGTSMTKEDFLKQSEELGVELEKRNKRHVTRCRKQLYDLVKFNTDFGEKVEIFCGWVRTPNPVKLGPPKEKIVIGLNDVLTSELLCLQHKLKIEIHNADLEAYATP